MDETASSVDMSFGSALSSASPAPIGSNNAGRVSDAPFVSPPLGGGGSSRVRKMGGPSPAFTLSSQSGIPATRELKKELTTAVARASARGLKQSAKWAAELLVGMPQDPVDEMPNPESGQSSPRYLLAKSYYDAGELMRCVHALSSVDDLKPLEHFGGRNLRIELNWRQRACAMSGSMHLIFSSSFGGKRLS